jgi:ferritin
MQEAMNEQIKWELFSAYLYLSMAAYFKGLNLQGFARWMEAQTLEELSHAIKFYNFVNDRGGSVSMQPIDGPPVSWGSPLEAFEDAYNHEVEVTKRINNLVDLALELRDHASNTFLQWFVTEQVEEEASTDDVVKKIRLVDKTQGGLYMLDQELGRRTFILPPGTTIIAGVAAAGA